MALRDDQDFEVKLEHLLQKGEFRPASQFIEKNLSHTTDNYVRYSRLLILSGLYRNLAAEAVLAGSNNAARSYYRKVESTLKEAINVYAPNVEARVYLGHFLMEHSKRPNDALFYLAEGTRRKDAASLYFEHWRRTLFGIALVLTNNRRRGLSVLKSAFGKPFQLSLSKPELSSFGLLSIYQVKLTLNEFSPLVEMISSFRMSDPNNLEQIKSRICKI